MTRCQPQEVAKELGHTTDTATLPERPSLGDVRAIMRTALLPSAASICDAHLQANSRRPAQLAGHLLLHFWIGASAACALSRLGCAFELWTLALWGFPLA